MRHVVNSNQVAHLWANQVQSDARTSSGNTSFARDVFYSYATPIARIVKSPRTGEPVALISNCSYSRTTAGKHAPAARRAVLHLASFRVPALGCSGGQHREPSGDMHAANCEALIAQYQRFIKRYMRTRSHLYGDIPAQVRENFALVAQYARLFDIGNKCRAMVRRIDPAADAALIETAHVKREAREADPKNGERLRKAREAREALAARKRAEVTRLQAEHAAQARAAFRAGAPRYGSIGGPCMLRLNGEHFETSQGATVSRKCGISMLSFIARIRVRGGSYEAAEGDGSPEVDGFKLRAITPEAVTIGCHEIPVSECVAMAALVGVEWPS